MDLHARRLLRQRHATDLLMSVSTEAQKNGEIDVSSIQGLSNIRHLADGKYALPDDTVNFLEGLIKSANKIGTVNTS